MSNNFMTSEPTTPNHIQQTLFVEDSLASQSQTRASAKGSQKLHNLVCGTNSIESFAYYDRDTSSWKTCQQSFLTDLESFLETWPRQGITANGVAFQRRILEPVTREIGGGLLPTPVATDYKGRSGQGFQAKHGAKRIADVLTQTGDGTRVNPCWTEEAMGYPIGYTELKR